MVIFDYSNIFNIFQFETFSVSVSGIDDIIYANLWNVDKLNIHIVLSTPFLCFLTDIWSYLKNSAVYIGYHDVKSFDFIPGVSRKLK